MIKLNECIKVLDYAARELDFKVISIKDPLGTEMIDDYDNSTSEISFNVPGVYTIIVSALDDSNRFTQVTIQVPVNK